jgi:hypothetical protein
MTTETIYRVYLIGRFAEGSMTGPKTATAVRDYAASDFDPKTDDVKALSYVIKNDPRRFDAIYDWRCEKITGTQTELVSDWRDPSSADTFDEVIYSLD